MCQNCSANWTMWELVCSRWEALCLGSTMDSTASTLLRWDSWVGNMILFLTGGLPEHHICPWYCLHCRHHDGQVLRPGRIHCDLFYSLWLDLPNSNESLLYCSCIDLCGLFCLSALAFLDLCPLYTSLYRWEFLPRVTGVNEKPVACCNCSQQARILKGSKPAQSASTQT